MAAAHDDKVAHLQDDIDAQHKEMSQIKVNIYNKMLETLLQFERPLLQSKLEAVQFPVLPPS
jgi:hypothetical protein